MTEAELHQKLQLCRAELLDSLQFDMMSPALIQEGIISPADYEGIQGSQSNSDKVTYPSLPWLVAYTKLLVDNRFSRPPSN